MDVQRIGNFLAELRKNKNLTQEELGEQIGVTNKTVSRWENGNYLPPVEMLQILSAKYDISINEILSGERLDGEKYKTKAEENIASALKTSTVGLKDKKDFLEKKWLIDHLLELILELLLMFSFAILSAIFCKELCVLLSIICLILAFGISKRRDTYVAKHLYGDGQTKAKNDAEKKSK